ncbi:MAG: glycosyltransferase family protein, partial [Planctomycetota bacterium]
MIEGRKILCFASGYDAPPTSKHHVVRLLAERNVVLWVNYHASRRPGPGRADLLRAAGRMRRVMNGLSRARRNLYVLTPMVLPLPGSAWARRVNRAMLGGQIRAALGSLGAGPLQVWSFCPDISYLLGCFEPEKVLYYCVDEFASFAGYARDRILRDEADLCRRADLVVASSRALYEAKLPFSARIIFVPHGVDFRHFAKAMSDQLVPPAEVAAIGRPRIAFF